MAGGIFKGDKMNIFATIAMVFSLMSSGYFTGDFSIRPAADLINWQVGDQMEYNINLSFLKGTAVNSVASEKVVDGTPAIWVTNNVDLMNQKQKIEQLIRRHDATVLQLLVNGQEQEVPDPGEVEIVEQDYVKVTVPAGTFKSIWMKINTKEQKGIEVWVNPKDTAMDGLLKMITPSQMGEMTMELTGFNKVQ